MAFPQDNSLLPIALTSQSQREDNAFPEAIGQEPSEFSSSGLVPRELSRRQAASSFFNSDGVRLSVDGIIAAANSSDFVEDSGYRNGLLTCEICPGLTVEQTSYGGYRLRLEPTNLLP